jgi:riboflavin kinase/FMN adenylyltransferase
VKIYEYDPYASSCEAVVALGCFDGVHKGHRALIETAKGLANKKDLPLCVFTFSEPPKNFFSSSPVGLITSNEHKLDILERLGVDMALCVTPSKEFFSLSAEDFIKDVLFEKLRAAHVVCGFNYTFGAGAKGNAQLLESICKENGVGLTVCPEYKENGITISSSLIRDAISEGNMGNVTKYLGRPFSISATVVNGQHLASKLGFPTVNMLPDPKLILPKNGVYLTKVLFEGNERYGITNVGLRPTVDTRFICVETHLFDFDGDLYGKNMTVEFLDFIRPETKFADINSMAEQIKRDIKTAKAKIKH